MTHQPEQPPLETVTPGQSDDGWRDLQIRFVDDPVAAVREAGGLVRQAIEQLVGATQQPEAQSATPDNDRAHPAHQDTERLRRAFTTLRDVHGRLRA